MKKALSIILCLSMLMTSFPVSVFAAPEMAPIGGETSQETAMDVTENEAQPVEGESADAVLEAENTVAPVKVLPKSDTTVDYRYPVAYYTFGSDVEINADDVTLENLGNQKAGGVYYDEDNNAVWVFPYAADAGYGRTVTFDAWTSSIPTSDGKMLYFPAVSFVVSKVPAEDGENLVPFGNMEYGWSPFHYRSNSKEYSTLEYLEGDTHNGVSLRSTMPVDPETKQQWNHNKVNVIWKPSTTYKVKYSVKFASFSYSGTASKDVSVTPDAVYRAKYFCSACDAEKTTSGSNCDSCGASNTVNRDHASSFTDHTFGSTVMGPSKGWVTFEKEYTTRNEKELQVNAISDMHFSVYSNPPATGSANFYIDDVEIYEKVNISFAEVAGKSALLGEAPEKLYGYNGDVVTLPVATDYFEAVAENYAVVGWTDGKNVYDSGANYVVDGCKVLTPKLAPTGEAVKVTFSVPEEFADAYNGFTEIEVNKGETVDLSEYALSAVAGYDAYWADADGNAVYESFVADADMTLVATFVFKESLSFETEAKYQSFVAGGADAYQNAEVSYDADNGAIVVNPTIKPNGTYDPIIMYMGLEIPTEHYAYIDVTLVKSDVTPVDESVFGTVFYKTDNASFVGSHNIKGAFYGFADEEQTKVIYRFNACDTQYWTGTCSAIRFDATETEVPWSLCEIKLVKDEVVESVEISDIALPALSTKPDKEATVPADAGYAVEKVEWDCATEYFGGSTQYTVSVTVKIADGVNGYMFGDETAVTINGEDAVVEFNEENPDVLVAQYTFPATEDAKDIEVTINNAYEITENNGTLVLDATVAPVNPDDEINPTTVSWAITGGDEGIAMLDGNVLKAVWDGTVTVTAVPDYNASEAVSFDVVISGQHGYTVTYNVSDDVTGAPESEEAKYSYTVSSVVPEREGFGFEGWTLVPGGTEAVTELNVVEDVDLYAMWSNGTFLIDFKKQSDYDNYISLACAKDIAVDTTGDGYLSLTVTQGSKTGAQAADMQINVYSKKGAENTNKNIPIDNVASYEIKYATDYSGSYTTDLYYTSHDGEGNYYSRPYGSGVPEDYTGNMFRKSAVYSGDLNDFVTVVFDTTTKPDAWKGYLGHARFDPMQGETAVGKKIVVDYIKLNGVRAVDYVDVTVPAPVALAEAAYVKDVEASSDAYTVESIEWAPALYDGRFFDAKTAYTATITVKAAAGYVLSESPAAGFVNGVENDIENVDDTLVFSYTFPSTADVEIANITLNTKNDEGAVVENRRLIFGDTIDFNTIIPQNAPKGSRWIGWSKTEDGSEMVDVVEVDSDAAFYAVYEKIEGFDFGNKYHTLGVSADMDGALAFVNGWAVVTPTEGQSISLITPKTYINAADYGKISVIYDASYEPMVDGVELENKFTTSLVPALYFEAGDGETYEGTLLSATDRVVANRKVVEYIYDMSLSEEWAGEIGSIILNPYTGVPGWQVKSLSFIANEPIEEAPVITDITAPETWGTPDVNATVSEKYTVESVEWIPELNESGKFNPATEYSAIIKLKPVSGYKIVNAEGVTVDGRETESIINADGSMYVLCAYEATEALIDFELTLEDGAIDVADGTIKLTPVFTPAVEGEAVSTTEVVWELVDNGPDDNCAILSEDGTIKGVYDGTIRVKATSVYDPSESAEATVVITNQIANYTIQYSAGAEGVTNMPETEYDKLDHKLSNKIPVRAGYKFAGWVKDPTDTASITKDYVTSDTTYYALWVKGVNYEFIGETLPSISNHFSTNGVYDAENGVYTVNKSTGTDPTISFNVGEIRGSDYPVIEVRVKSSMASNGFQVFFTSDSIPGYTESATLRQDYSAKADEFTTVRLDMSQISSWNDGIIKTVRLDPVSKIVDFYEIDYIRVVNYECGVIDVAGVDKPVAKAVADTSAESLNPTAIEVVDVSWEPALLYDYYFDGDTEYTAAVTVRGVGGYFVSEMPAVYKINGTAADDYYYDNEAGTLTLYKSFPATGSIDSSEAYQITLVASDIDGNDVEEVRTIFKGDSFALGSYAPSSAPSGKRWTYWTDEDGNRVESIVVTGDAVYYAQYETLTEIDYANPDHRAGTTSKGAPLAFADDLAIVQVTKGGVDTALITAETNIAASDVSYINVYYSATLDGKVNGVHMDNIFNATLVNPVPALKFSTVDAPDTYNQSKLISAERVLVGDALTFKYTYSMTESDLWSGIISKFYLDPYTVDGDKRNHYRPQWGVRLIEFVQDTRVESDIMLDISAPETAFTPATYKDVSVNAPYTVKSITWTGEVAQDGTFLPDTAYAVEAVVASIAGYTGYAGTAYVNGEDATVVDNGNGTYNVRYEFEVTGAVEDVEVTITGENEITSSGKSIQLTADVVSASGIALPTTEVTWSVNDTSIATVSENGRVYPARNGTVVVRATSVYNTDAYAEHEITISNQGELYTVTFDKNTKDAVTGLPEAVTVRGKFVPEEYNPVRNGYFFTGWSVDEDAVNPDKSFNITADTTLYAKWSKGYEWNCNDSSNIIKVTGSRTARYENGIAYLGASSSAILMENSVPGEFRTAENKQIQISVSLPAAGYLKTYVQSKNGAGSTVSPWNESASVTMSGLLANAPGEFQTVTFDYTNHANWNMYELVSKIRFDSDVAKVGEIAIDWIRLINLNRRVKFDGNGGLIPLYDGYVESYKQTYNCGEISLRSVPVREGYTFVGWSKKPDSFEKIYKGKFTVSDDVTLYAMWMPGNTYYGVSDEKLEELVVVENEDGAVTEGVNVKSDDDGIHISAESVVTPTVKIADSVVVNDEHKVISVVVDYKYSNVEDATIYLSFVPEGETEARYVVIAEDLADAFTGNIVADLSEIAYYTGTVTELKLVFQTGIPENITVEKVIIADEATADSFGTQASTGGGSTIERSDVIVNGSEDTDRDENVPGGTGTIVSHAKSTVKKPNKKVTNTSTNTGSGTGTGSSTPAPAAPDYVVTKTSASGDIVFEFDNADDEKLINSYRHMAKKSYSNSVITITNNTRPEGDKNSPAFFTPKMNLDAATHRYIIIKNNCKFSAADSVRIYFQTATEKFSEKLTVNATLSMNTTGYTVADMGSNASWKGTITGLFFSFGDKKGDIEIDAIIFSNDKNTVSKSDNKFPFVNDFTATTFNDVKSADWFYGDVEKSYRMNLMNGKGEGIFDPNGNVTLAEAITIAARVNALYNGKTIADAAAGQKWYEANVAYAVSAGIIKAGQFADVTKAATRSEVAVIFANALPASSYTAKNVFTAIPDVASSDAAFSAILKLYNAGIVVGVDEAYNFQPANNIKRSEIAAIINRVVLPESRVKVYTKEELESMTIYYDANKLAGISLSGCEEGKLTLKDGLAYGKAKTVEGKSPDPIVNCGSIVGEGIDATLYKTIEIGVKYGDDVPTGSTANVFFTTPEISWSEKARLDAKYDGTKDANGISVLKFDGAANANWKGTVTSFRFDPFNIIAEFSVAYIKLVPTID